MTPYYEHAGIQIYLGDCLEVEAWMDGHMLLTDPPFGIAWKQGALKRSGSDAHAGIANDHDTAARDYVLNEWGDTNPAAVFGSLSLCPPEGTKQILVYQKPPNAGVRGAIGGFRRDVEAIYLIGNWSSGLGGRSSVLRTDAPTQGNPSSYQGRFGHPHAKPLDILHALIAAAELDDGAVIVDPFMGSGSTLVAAKSAGYRAIGIEVVEKYAEIAAKRLGQEVLF